VKEVASLTENGTSRTLARVLASSVFPAFWLLKGATKVDKSLYLNQLALCKENCHECCDMKSEWHYVQYEDITLLKCWS
jgi:hypothetical protein